MSLAERVREARERKGMTQADLASAAGISQQAVNLIETGKTKEPRQSWRAIAAALDIPEEEMQRLMGESARSARVHYANDPTPLPVKRSLFREAAPLPSNLPKTMPVMGHAAGSPLGQGHVVFGEPIEWVARPPWLENVDAAYAIYAVGESMVPRFYPGELLHVHPHRQPRPGDFVVAQIQGPNDPELTGYIKQFVRFDKNGLVLHQFNPDTDMTFDSSHVKALHKIIIPGLS